MKVHQVKSSDQQRYFIPNSNQDMIAKLYTELPVSVVFESPSGYVEVSIFQWVLFRSLVRAIDYMFTEQGKASNTYIQENYEVLKVDVAGGFSYLILTGSKQTPYIGRVVAKEYFAEIGIIGCIMSLYTLDTWKTFYALVQSVNEYFIEHKFVSAEKASTVK